MNKKVFRIIDFKFTHVLSLVAKCESRLKPVKFFLCNIYGKSKKFIM